MPLTTVKLSIAGVVIAMQSEFPLEKFTPEDRMIPGPERFTNFFYYGKKRSQINIQVKVVKELPKLPQEAKILFITYHPQDNKENWRLMEAKGVFIYASYLHKKEQIVFVHKKLNQATAFLLPKEAKGLVWDPEDLIYDFLQILLISYFAKKKTAIFMHSLGIRDIDGRGLLFAAESGGGKSTSARFWYKFTRAKVLNDDRVIVSKQNGKFIIHSSPWHGDFHDYLSSYAAPAELDKLFFIHHSPRNDSRKISSQEAFHLLYPLVFPTFWDRASLANIVSFCQELVSGVKCFRFGFVKNKSAIDFSRRIK